MNDQTHPHTSELPHLTPARSRRDLRNALLFVLGEGLWGFQAAMTASATVLTLLLKGLGAGQVMLGSISAIEGTLFVLPQLLGLYLFRSKTARKRQLVRYHFLCIIPFIVVNGLLILAGGAVPESLLRWLILGCFTAMVACIGVIGAVWLNWIADLFHTGIRGTVMGISFFCSALLGTAGSLLAGCLLRHIPDRTGYGILFVVAGVIAFASLATFWFVDDPAGVGDQRDVEPFSLRAMLARFRSSLREANFRNFLVGRMLSTFGFCVPPYLAVYYQSAAGGGLTADRVVTCGAAMTFGLALANLAFGRLGDKRGHHIGVVSGALLQVVTLSVLLLSSGVISCLFAYFCAGLCMGVAFVSHSNMLFESCPHDHRLSHITVGNLIMSAPLAAAPLLAGLVAETWDVRMVFRLCAGFSVLAAVWFALLVRDPRAICRLEK